MIVVVIVLVSDVDLVIVIGVVSGGFVGDLFKRSFFIGWGNLLWWLKWWIEMCVVFFFCCFLSIDGLWIVEEV